MNRAISGVRNVESAMAIAVAITHRRIRTFSVHFRDLPNHCQSLDIGQGFYRMDGLQIVW